MLWVESPLLHEGRSSPGLQNLVASDRFMEIVLQRGGWSVWDTAQ